MASYRSHKGKMVDMEELRRKHENTVAAGNMNTNARGDVLGRGGKIVETAANKARKFYTSTQTTRSTVSIKSKDTQDPVFQEEVRKLEVTKKQKEKADAKAQAEAIIAQEVETAKKKKIIEVEDEDGNLTVQEIDEE